MSEVDAFVARMNRLAAVYERSPRDMVATAAARYTKSIRSSINASTSGGKLRGVGKKGGRVGVRYNVVGETAIVQATGPLQLIERDTKAHAIPRTAKSRRLRTAAGRLSRKRELTGRTASGRKVLRLANGEFVTGPIEHPGTKGKHVFERGVVAAETQATLDALTGLRRAVGDIFKAAG